MAAGYEDTPELDLNLESVTELGAKAEGLEQLESGAEKGAHVPQPESPREFWEGPAPVKREPEGALQEGWDAQWQQFLGAVPSPSAEQGKPALLQFGWRALSQVDFSPSEAATDTHRQPCGEAVAQLPPGLAQEAPGSPLAKEESSCSLVQEEGPGAECVRQRFRQFRYQEAEGPREVCVRLRELCRQWLQPEKHSKEQIVELLVLEQFLSVLPPQIQTRVREGRPGSCGQAVALAEQFQQQQQQQQHRGEDGWEGWVPQVLKAETASSSEAGVPPDSCRTALFQEIKEEQDTDVPCEGRSIYGQGSLKVCSLAQPATEPSLFGASPRASSDHAMMVGMKRATEHTSKAVMGPPLGVIPGDGVKTEVQDPAESIPWEGLLPGDTPEHTKQEPECLEDQGQMSLKVQEPLPCEEGEAQLLTSGLRDTWVDHAPGKGASDTVLQPGQMVMTQLSPGVSRESHQSVNPVWAKKMVDYREAKEEPPDEGAASPEEEPCFRRFCYQEAEGPREACGMLWKLCCQWLQLEEKTKEQVLELVVLEQFLAVLPKDMQSWVRDRRPETCFQAVGLAEEFLVDEEDAKPQDCQVLRLFKEEAADAPKADGAQSGPENVLLFREAKQDDVRGSSQAGCKSEFWKEKSLPVDLKEVELHGKPPGREQAISQHHDLDSVSENQQKTSGNKGSKSTNPPHDFEQLHPVPAPQKTLKGETCAECGKSFRCKAELTEHQRMHSGEKPYMCLDCRKSFCRRNVLVAHQRIHTGEKPFTCPDCGKSFNQRSHLTVHERTHTQEKPFACPDCGQNFSRRTGLVAHQRIHTGEKPYHCPDCGKSFRQRFDLIRHQRIHTGEKPHECPDCGKSFRNKSSFLVHRRIHTEEKPYPCSSCGKSFRHRTNLLAHERIHTGEKPYKCSECGKSFGDGSSLMKHKRAHTGEKPYKCLECGKAFSQNAGLVQHGKIHTGEKPYQCPDCSKSFRDKSAFIVHQRTHTREKPYCCVGCDKSFSHRSNLLKHERIHTGEKPYKCLDCGKGFTQKPNLLVHERTHSKQRA